MAFAVNAVSFAAVLFGLASMNTAALRRAPRASRVSGGAREGLRYVWGHPELRACMLLVAVIALFGQNFRVVLPLLARDTLGGGAEFYGWLTSALGIGAVLGGLASAGRRVVTSWSLLRWTWIFGGVNVVAAFVPGLGLALGMMVALGIANISFNTLARTMLQVNTEPEMQGRVIALHSFVFLGSTPIGGPVAGWLCERWGAGAGLLLAGVSAGLAALAARPLLRRERAAPGPVQDPAPDSAQDHVHDAAPDAAPDPADDTAPASARDPG
ncbi:MFS transporter [Actinophytocola sp.]|uniref:MFS transporter n=1 Tax=Actinophytocola sp. TaxID=1872138 RepID=UPI0025BC3ED1|nr:MFS transporter [Actinophytocola sp.]